MIQSMTGFGSAEKGPFKVEIRSLNHRFLDISIKIPQNLGGHEIPLRNMIKERFSRGRFDVLVSMAEGEALGIKINMGLAREIHDALRTLKDELSLSGTLGIETIAGFRELIFTEEVSFDTDSLYAAFDAALEKLLDMRIGEGEATARDFLSRIELLEAMNKEVERLSPEVVKRCMERFTERLNLLISESSTLGGAADENRVLQEAAIMADKTDISEEITRITSHIAQMRKILSEGDTIGRKVEFLLQELNREANTIASKADDYRVSSVAVEMKAEIEKMREQAQNIQ